MASITYPNGFKGNSYVLLISFAVTGQTWESFKSENQVPLVTTPEHFYTLPIPKSGIVDSHSFTYEEAKSGLLSGDLMSSLTNVAKGAADQFNLTNMASMITGKVIDPNLTPIFKGSNLRSLSFTWEFSPRTKGDSEALTQLIVALRRDVMAPVSKEVTDGKTNIMGMPNAFGITVMLNGTSPEVLPNLLRTDGHPCNWVCENFSVEYGGGDQFSYFDETNQPTTVSLTMQFKEMQKQYRA